MVGRFWPTASLFCSRAASTCFPQESVFGCSQQGLAEVLLLNSGWGCFRDGLHCKVRSLQPAILRQQLTDNADAVLQLYPLALDVVPAQLYL